MFCGSNECSVGTLEWIWMFYGSIECSVSTLGWSQNIRSTHRTFKSCRMEMNVPWTDWMFCDHPWVYLNVLWAEWMFCGYLEWIWMFCGPTACSVGIVDSIWMFCGPHECSVATLEWIWMFCGSIECSVGIVESIWIVCDHHRMDLNALRHGISLNILGKQFRDCSRRRRIFLCFCIFLLRFSLWKSSFSSQNLKIFASGGSSWTVIWMFCAACYYASAEHSMFCGIGYHALAEHSENFRSAVWSRRFDQKTPYLDLCLPPTEIFRLSC